MTKRITRTSRARWGLTAAIVAMAVASCEEAGLNQNEQKAGDGDQGAELTYGAIAIDPTGKYLLSSSYGRLIHAGIEGGEPRVLKGLEYPERVAFGHDDHTLFVSARSAPASKVGTISRVDLADGSEAWSIPTDIGYSHSTSERLPWLNVTDDDRFLIVAHAQSVEVRDALTGEVKYETGTLEREIVDVDLTPDQTTLVVTTIHEWVDGSPSTLVLTWDLETFTKVAIDVPNCSSELVVGRGGKSAFLAPSRCSKDPISLLDLTGKKWVRNLPGFGPVALSPKGDLAVGFINMQNLDEALFLEGDPIPSDDVQYHLMLIDTQSLRFSTVKLGNTIPRYAVSPNGKMLLIDDPTWYEDGRIRVLDVATKQLTTVKGPPLDLRNYVVTSDSREIYLLDEGLYRVSLEGLRADTVPIAFTPSAINITPDDQRLVLRETEGVLKVFAIGSGDVERTINLTRLAARGELEVDVDVDVSVDIDIQ